VSLVSPEGQPLTVDLERSSNFARLDEAARQAVARWRFVPCPPRRSSHRGSGDRAVVFRLES
jgi:periplasmic protein TonB